MISPIPLTFILRIHILMTECLSKHLDLLFQAVLGHHQSEVETSLRFLVFSRKQMEDDTATEADDSGTLTIGVLHMINGLGSLDTFLLYPSLNGLPQTGHIHQSCKRAQTGHGLLNTGFVLCRTLSKLGHLREATVGHLGNQHTARKTVLDIVRLKALS